MSTSQENKMHVETHDQDVFGNSEQVAEDDSEGTEQEGVTGEQCHWLCDDRPWWIITSSQTAHACS